MVASVVPGVWHQSLSAEDIAIVSDKYDLALFLVRFHQDGRDAYIDEELIDMQQKYREFKCPI